MTTQALLRRSGSDRRGRPYLIRPTSGEDAEGLVGLRDAVAAEGRWVAATAGERSVVEERLALASLLANGGVALSLEVDGRLCGQLTVSRLRGPYQAHIGELAVSIDPDHRDAGLGRELVGTAVAWARAVGLRRLQLGVFPDNARAIAVYRSCGFVEEGVQRAAVRTGGRERDLVLMALLL